MIATIGGFDGMHLGHQALIKKAEIVIVIEKGSNLTPGTDRCEYTALPCKFYNLKEIKHLSATNFINLLKNMDIKKVVIGNDFRFGKDRIGDINLLQKHFKVEVVDEVKIRGKGVHSRIIREFIKNGEIKKANKFLGHLYKIKGDQIKGQGLGSKELVATININLIKSYLLPKPGVYITITNNQPSLTFIGERSTDNNFSIETHILIPKPISKLTYFPSPFYLQPSPFIQLANIKAKANNVCSHLGNGINSKFRIPSSKLIEIEFLEFLRENRKFDDLKDLKDQINNDIKKAEKFFTKNVY